MRLIVILTLHSHRPLTRIRSCFGLGDPRTALSRSTTASTSQPSNYTVISNGKLLANATPRSSFLSLTLSLTTLLINNKMSAELRVRLTFAKGPSVISSSPLRSTQYCS